MTQIPMRHASRLLDSVAFLNEHRGVALNAMVTINFEALGRKGVERVKQALCDMNEFLARKIAAEARRFRVDWPHFYVYAHERSAEHGWHVHELMVVPAALRLDVRGWLDGWTQRNFGSGARERRAVHFRYGGGSTNLTHVATTQARLVRYILKTARPEQGLDRLNQWAAVHDLIGLSKVRRSAHLDVPRLVGVSQNLTLRAQMAAGYDPLPHWEDLLSEDNLIRHRQRARGQELHAQLMALPA